VEARVTTETELMAREVAKVVGASPVEVVDQTKVEGATESS